MILLVHDWVIASRPATGDSTKYTFCTRTILKDRRRRWLPRTFAHHKQMIFRDFSTPNLAQRMTNSILEHDQTDSQNTRCPREKRAVATRDDNFSTICCCCYSRLPSFVVVPSQIVVVVAWKSEPVPTVFFRENFPNSSPDKDLQT